MKAKRIIAIVSLVVILAAGIFAAVTAAGFERTYDGKNDAVDLYLDHENGISDKLTEADGIAEIIVVQNLAREEGMGTMAQNNVAAVVFDYRGFDTLGESFILLTAIAGSFVILSMAKKKKEDDK